MNSSLLVPALIVVAVTAGVFVFGEGLFSSGSSEEASKYSSRRPIKVKTSEGVADNNVSVSADSDFSWDDDTTYQSPVKRSSESFVSSKQSEEAPGDVYGSEFDSKANSSFDAVKDLAATEFESRDDLADADLDDLATAVDGNAASKQVDDDLSDFFDSASKETESGTSPARSSVSASALSSSTAKTIDPSDLDVALATPKSKIQGVDAFDDFGPAPSDLKLAPKPKADDEMESVVMPNAEDAVAKSSDVATSDADGVISGALEPVKDSSPSTGGSSTNGVSAKASLRKFKITNPKETTLPVTLSVDGKQVTLKPDQSFVIQQSDGDVEVSFSRGGSFGFETRTLKSGFYRFSVSREAGWKLIN